MEPDVGQRPSKQLLDSTARGHRFYPRHSLVLTGSFDEITKFFMRPKIQAERYLAPDRELLGFSVRNTGKSSAKDCYGLISVDGGKPLVLGWLSGTATLPPHITIQPIPQHELILSLITSSSPEPDLRLDSVIHDSDYDASLRDNQVHSLELVVAWDDSKHIEKVYTLRFQSWTDYSFEEA